MEGAESMSVKRVRWQDGTHTVTRAVVLHVTFLLPKEHEHAV